MNIVVDNGRKVFVDGIIAEAAMSSTDGKTRLAFWPHQKKPEFKAGFEFQLDDRTWIVLEIGGGSPLVARIQLTGKD